DLDVVSERYPLRHLRSPPPLPVCGCASRRGAGSVPSPAPGGRGRGRRRTARRAGAPGTPSTRSPCNGWSLVDLDAPLAPQQGLPGGGVGDVLAETGDALLRDGDG